MADKKGKVLCVDDEPGILRSLKWLLQKEFEVHTASSGQDGLALVRQHDFDVVISDQRMPGMTGSEFLREVRLLAPRAMRILLTGYSDFPAILRSVNESEVFRFINKPWNIDELPKVVAEATLIAQTHPVEARADNADDASSDEAKSEVILVIDDDPGVVERILQEVGAQATVVQARNIAEAVAVLNERNVGILLSDTRVGSVDTTRMLKVLKETRPGIVTVVFTAQTDAVDVITLINQGQIFRFILKPLKPVTLMLAVTAATLKRKQLRDNPKFALRHAVDGTAQDLKDSLANDIQQVAKASVPQTIAAAQSGLLNRVAGSFRWMFGGR